MGKIGLFIVEFMGNGVSARAVVKKGRLSLVHRSTVAGHLCYIIDHDKKICKGDKRIGVYFQSQQGGTNKQFYAAEKDTGRIFIPFQKGSEHSSKVIMVNDGFAQLGEFTRKTEKYGFDASFFLNKESVLVGSSTQIVIKPHLTINDRPADVSMLKNSKVIV